jgi:uncharacterized phage protein (TIGR02220 family)
MITRKTRQCQTVITLSNYATYASSNKKSKDSNKDADRTATGHQSDTHQDKEEEDKEVNKIKKTTLSGNPDAKGIIDYLNEQTGRSFRYAEAHLKLITTRLKEKDVTVEGVKEMIDARCGKWLLDDKMTEYLRPQTLFAKTKFANYYDQRNQQFKTGGTTDDDHAKGF